MSEHTGFMPPRITAWSFSRLSTWENCPAQAKYKFIQKLPYPASSAAERGNIVHKACEDFILRKRKSLQVFNDAGDLVIDLSKIRPYLQFFVGGTAEQQRAFTKDWEPTEWFGPQVYVRVITDADKMDEEGTVFVADHKTGKKYEDHPDQAELNGIAGLLANPDAKDVVSEMNYIDNPHEETRVEFTREDMPGLIAKWDERAGKMLADTDFVPKPNRKCRWCPYARNAGGPCQFNG